MVAFPKFAEYTAEQVQLFDRHLSFIFSELMAEVS